jgi:hypothetical protein
MKYNGINRGIPVFMEFTTLRHAHCISIDEKNSARQRPPCGRSLVCQTGQVAGVGRLAVLAQPAPQRGLMSPV